jgi:hypothetical protein
MARLEAVGAEMNDGLDLVKNAGRALEQARGKVAENVKNKLKKRLERNDGSSTMCKINDILGGNGATLGEEDPALDSSDVTLQILTLDIVRRGEKRLPVQENIK